jgi:uncharacterized membrane protein YhhN
LVNAIIVIGALSLLVGLLIFVKKESAKGILLTKPSLSALFVIVAITGPSANPTYFGFVLAGLLFCVAGDVLLIFTAKELFLSGLVSFLAGHVLYSIAFFTMASLGTFTWIIALLFLLISGAVFIWLRTHLGRMLVPVIAYMAVITVMVIGAASLASNEQLCFTGTALVFCGAILFYFSDIFVARHRFVKKQYFNRLVGLPIYYTGQFMIAYSLRFI